MANEPDRLGESEARALAERYARRPSGSRYSALRPDVWHSLQERQRALLRLFVRLGIDDLSALRLLELGCGGGGNLLEMLRLGFAPQHLSGIELLPERFAIARAALPPAVRLQQGDALQADVAAGSQDIVMLCTVLSSVLDDAVQQALADAVWRWLRPGGGVLWYDFTVDNPRNRDVRGVPLRRLRQLFPQAQWRHAQRVTLAPPLARAVTRLHPSLYTLFNAVPWLRTHALVWLAKPV